MIVLVSVTCSSGHLAKIHNDRDNLGWKEENKQIFFFLSHICESPMIILFVDIKYMYLYILSLINLLNRQQN